VKNKTYLLLIFFITLLSGETENSREDIKMRLIDSYRRRASLDRIKRFETLKKWLEYHSKELGITKEELICSTFVIARDIEPDVKRWPQRMINNPYDKEFGILLYILCIEGDSTAINTMKRLLHGVNGDKVFAKFAAEALFQSSAAWYPVAEYIADSGSSSLRYLLYASYLKRWVFYKSRSDETKDSVAQIVCRGMLKEIEPTHLIDADTLLIQLYKEEYRFCIERLYVLKKRIENKDYQEFLKKHKEQKNYFKHAKEIISNVLQTKEKYSSPRFRKYFNIAEDLDTVDIHFDEND